MMTKTLRFILLFVSLFVLVGMIGILCVAVSFGNSKESDINIYSAKVESIVCNTIGLESTYRIYTNEYDKYLLIEQAVASVYDFNKVQKGDSIVFGIESRYGDFLDTDIESDADFFVTIVSLECEGETIFTIDDYNEIYQNATNTPLLVNILLIIISFIVFVISLLSIIRTNRRRFDKKIKGRFETTGKSD